MVILKKEIVSFFFQFVLFATIYRFINDKMKLQREKKQFAQDHTACSGRDDIWCQVIWEQFLLISMRYCLPYFLC